MLRWQRVDVWKGNGGGLEETVVAKEMEVDGGWMEAASCLNISAKRPHAFRACIAAPNDAYTMRFVLA